MDMTHEHHTWLQPMRQTSPPARSTRYDLAGPLLLQMSDIRNAWRGQGMLLPAHEQESIVLTGTKASRAEILIAKDVPTFQ